MSLPPMPTNRNPNGSDCDNDMTMLQLFNLSNLCLTFSLAFFQLTQPGLPFSNSFNKTTPSDKSRINASTCKCAGSIALIQCTNVSSSVFFAFVKYLSYFC